MIFKARVDRVIYMKFKLVTVLLVSTLSFLSFGAAFLYFLKFDPKKYYDLYPSPRLDCRLNSKLSFDQLNCHSNAAKAFLEDRPSTATIDVFEYLCANGLTKSCRVRDWFNYVFSSVLYTPPISNIDSNIKNCFDFKKPYFEKEYYCDHLSLLATELNDLSTKTNIKIMKSNFNYQDLDLSPREFFSTEIALSNYYYESKCQNSSSSVCVKLKPWHDLKNIMLEALDKREVYERLKKIVSEICGQDDLNCKMIIEDSNFLALSYIYSDIDFFKMLPLSYEGASFISGSIQQKDSDYVLNPDWLLKIKSRYLKFMLLNFDKKNDQILDECMKSKDKSGCFLSFHDVKSAKKNVSILKDFCLSGDSQSCIILNIFKLGLESYTSDEIQMISLLEQKEVLIGSELVNRIQFKIASFLAKNRNIILVLLIFIVLVFQVYIIHLYSKSSDVFQYIRAKTIEDLKNKLKSKSDNHYK
jgi:hypothetical protein